ncbi:MAG: peptidoglycan DD-metalloendopeptidase family protein [Lachnospiraceae bacterium]|nr:peptidoglycan DD-metalloendopeptidase family protein [Lachnospiraceae bacterium]MCI8872988.1 peptidoglycan DD-metalloendopeptidase family protein [Lachnospiraceae bacterium]
MVVAAFGMLGLYYAGQEREQEEQLAKERQQQVQQAKEEDAAREQAAVEKAREQAAAEAKARMKAKKKEEEETEEVSGMIEPVEDDFMDEPEVVAETSAPVQPELHFDAAADLSWPLQGNVILNYNMDQTVYFATLDQYKYNPAVILQAAVNTPVNAVASGEVVSIETSEETGLTMTVDMGDGYSARYGQLKEVPKNQGDYVDSGEILGYVSEPTKYYSVEGSNLYFQLLKDDQPVNPMEYLE